MDFKNKFTEIYNAQQWGNGSGEGSLPKHTAQYRKFLTETLKRLGVKRVLDLGCGDWQFSKLMDWDGIDYIGMDVVPDLIEQNNKAYGGKNIRFVAGDIHNGRLPHADLVLIKDVLQHWPTESIKDFLPRLHQFHYALITNDNYPDKTRNKEPDESYGHFRPIALTKKPFNLEAEKVFDFRTDPKMPAGFNNKEVLLMETANLKRTLYRLRYML